MSYWIRFWIVLFSVVLGCACSRESQQTQPVTTTTEKGTSTAPPAKEVEQRGRTLVRVVHAMPGSPALDMFADEAKAFANISYKTVTPYKELSGKLPPTPPVTEVPTPSSNKLQVVFRLRPAAHDTTQTVAEATEVLTLGNHYTVIALPSAEGKEPSLKISNDDLTPAPLEKARVRVIHASPDAGEVDVYAKERDKALFDGVNFMSEVGYKEVEPMTATLEVRPKGKKDTLATTSNVKWEAGKTYTIIITGRAKGAPKLEAVTVEDQLGSSTASIKNVPSATASY
jgi:Domain of unknown function (DUF4397)